MKHSRISPNVFVMKLFYSGGCHSAPDVELMNYSRYGPFPLWSGRYGPPPCCYGPPELVIVVHLG